MAYDVVSDELLLNGLCAGDDRCAAIFMQRYWRRLCWIAFGIVGDSDCAEDVAQVALERAWRRGATFDPSRGSLDAWMTTIARNAALDWLRMNRAIPTDPSELCMSSTPESCDLEDEDQFEDVDELEDRRTKIRSALTSLSPVLLRPVVLVSAFGLTAAEVARHEHIPLGTAKSRIRVAKQRLRRQLQCLR